MPVKIIIINSSVNHSKREWRVGQKLSFGLCSGGKHQCEIENSGELRLNHSRTTET